MNHPRASAHTPKRILTLDLGNTALTAGLWDGGVPADAWSSPFRAQSLRKRLQVLRQERGVDSAILASVVPARNRAILDICRDVLGLECSVLDSKTPTGLTILYLNPEQVGADRIANAVGAFHRCGGPVIAVDFGTAITFDVVSDAFEYLGGVIAPGLVISTEALFKKAALLPKVKISIPGRVLGRETSESIRSGVYWGTLGLVDRIIRELKKELGWGRETRLVATGGYAGLILSRSRLIREIDPLLTLRGLYLIAQKISPLRHEDTKKIKSES
ncbi:MAG: type III pantothenate kinase [PVC group bacterium]